MKKELNDLFNEIHNFIDIFEYDDLIFYINNRQTFTFSYFLSKNKIEIIDKIYKYRDVFETLFNQDISLIIDFDFKNIYPYIDKNNINNILKYIIHYTSSKDPFITIYNIFRYLLAKKETEILNSIKNGNIIDDKTFDLLLIKLFNNSNFKENILLINYDLKNIFYMFKYKISHISSRKEHIILDISKLDIKKLNDIEKFNLLKNIKHLADIKYITVKNSDKDTTLYKN